METDGTLRNILETTCIVQARARLTPTLTHVITYELVISGAEDDAISNLQFHSVLIDLGFKRTHSDAGVYHRLDVGGSTLIIILYDSS